MRLILLALGFGLTVATSPLFAGQVTLEGRAFQIPDGFELRRVTTTNLVLRPVNACFDDRGRLYVTDSSGSSEAPAEQAKNPLWRVIRLEDTDHDGVFDKSVIFADKLPMLQGILWHEGVVYIGGTPSIWKLTDKDGDGHADEKVEWWNVGRPSTHCGNEVHGPYAGPDGLIYWTKGAFEPITWTDGPSGKSRTDRGAHIFRARPDGSGMESIMTGGMDNPVEVAFTADGECLFTSTFIDFSQPGFRDGLAHAVFGGVYGKLNSNIEDRAVKRTSPDVLHPFVQFGAGAPSGLCRYGGNLFGSSYQDNFFASLFNLHKITRHQLKPGAGTYTAETSDFVVTDDVDFHPTDVLQDPDGSLLIVDTGGWYKLCCPTSQLWKPDVFGCLYRVVRAGWEKAAASVSVVVKGSGSKRDIGARATLENWQQNLVKHANEPFIIHSIRYALIHQAKPEDLRAALQSSEVVVKSSALVALAERDGSDLTPEELTPFLSASEPEIRRIAEWILQRRPEWGATLARWVQREYSKWAKEGKLDQIIPMLPFFTGDEAGQWVIARSGGRKTSPVNLRKAAFEAIAKSGVKNMPPEWAGAMGIALGEGNSQVLPQTLEAARHWQGNDGTVQLETALRNVVLNPETPVEYQIKALGALPPRSPLSAVEFDLLRAHIRASEPAATRSPAVGALIRSMLSVTQLNLLTDSLKEVGPLDLNALLAVYEGLADPALGARLLESLRVAKARRSLRAEILKPRLAAFPADIQEQAKQLALENVADTGKQAEKITSLLNELTSLKRDVRHGQSVFNSTKAACSQCHRIGYAGGNVGPDLTKIGEARTERDLLEAVVLPSASFVRSFEPMVVVTKDGETHHGLIRQETDKDLVLVTGPGAEQRLAKSDITDQAPGTVSLMPAGLDEQLTRQDLADLIAFLKNTKWGAN